MAVRPSVVSGLLTVCLLSGICSLAATALSGQQGAPGRTTLDGVYTAEQAMKGKQTYQRTCVACHTLDWYSGDMVRAWEGGSLYGLFEIISTTMPQDNPGSLPRRAYLDMMAYILELNEMPAGEDPLPVGRSALTNIRFKWKDNP